MNDIQNKEDIKLFVNAFYDAIKNDELLGPIFASKIADDRWPLHLNTMYDFWNSVLFGSAEYRGNPFSKHRQLPISKEHFERWISLFNGVINANFQGDKADETILHANKMRLMFESKLAANHPTRISII